MNIFLRDIAELLLKEYGSGLSEHCVVFPNNRSILFFRKYLSELIDKPVFMPSLQTISSLTEQQSNLKKAEPLELVYQLYRIYEAVGKRKETFDDFYFWGEMLLGDFDDIDKYFVDPDLLFTNLSEMKEIDEKFGVLGDEVMEIIRQFWINFDATKMTGEKSDFLSVWQILPAVYRKFKSSLKDKGLAYEGMIIREQAEEIQDDPGRWNKDIKIFHIVGFNALNKCERVIFKNLEKEGRVRFYWDYDNSFVDNTDHEAGHFIRENLEEFSNSFPASPDHKDCRINVFSAPSDVAQAKLIPSLINNYKLSDDPNSIAVVLADENLLSPVLNSLPGDVKNINVTMGYPLFQTPAYSLVHQLLRLQKNSRTAGMNKEYYYNDVINLLQHQYIAFNYPGDVRSVINNIKQKNLVRVNRDELMQNDLFKEIFNKEYNTTSYLSSILSKIILLLDDEQAEPGRSGLSLQQEFIYNLVLPLNQLAKVIESSDMGMGIDLYTRLADRLMRSIVVPFSGEPLKGLQVMGILETRTLDFENIIFLSANEGKIPRSHSGNSYIPHNLRQAFGLPTIKYSDSIYAYYFYRLLQRSSNVDFIYNNSTEGTRSGEMSRFLLQLKYDDNYNTSFVNTRFNILPSSKVSQVIERSDKINDVLESRYLEGPDKKILSPSAINTWINCNMRFYYRYIAGISEEEEVLEEVDSLAFGNILHHVMNDIYEPYKGKTLDYSGLEDICKDTGRIDKLVEDNFRKIFMKNAPGSIRGKNLVVTNIIGRMVKQIILADHAYAPLTLKLLESHVHGSVDCEIDGRLHSLLIGGTIDRVDITGGTYRILDYKSGTDSTTVKSLESLFDYTSNSRNSAAFQTLLYCELFMQDKRVDNIRPSLYPVRNIFRNDFSDVFVINSGVGKGKIESYSDLRTDFVNSLRGVLSDVFDRGRDITMTEDKQKCRYCPYNTLCNRMS